MPKNPTSLNNPLLQDFNNFRTELGSTKRLRSIRIQINLSKEAQHAILVLAQANGHASISSFIEALGQDQFIITRKQKRNN